jgi:hypothetical protein
MNSLRKDIADVWKFYCECVSYTDYTTTQKQHHENCHKLIAKKLDSYEQKYMGKVPMQHYHNLTKLKSMHKEFSKDYLMEQGYELAFMYGQFN